MKIGINLATEPFRRDRPLILGSVVVGALLLGLLCMLVYIAASERSMAAEARSSIARLDSQLQVLTQEQTKLEAVLREPKNAEVLERSLFLNSLLLRKGVSWTRIFQDLEKVTPSNVRVVTVRPQINNATNELMLDMVVGAQSSDPVNTFVAELEKSAVFSLPTVHNSQPPSQTDPLYKYRISVNYAQKL